MQLGSIGAGREEDCLDWQYYKDAHIFEASEILSLPHARVWFKARSQHEHSILKTRQPLLIRALHHVEFERTNHILPELENSQNINPAEYVPWRYHTHPTGTTIT